MSLINSILDFTQEEFDKEPRMNYKPVDIREEIKLISPPFKMKAEIREIDWLCEID